jgi:hypothetical protein
MAAGPIIAALGVVMFLRLGNHPSYLTDILPGVLIFGIGLSVTVAPLTSAILGAIDSRQAGIGSAVNNAVARIAGLIAIAVVGLLAGTNLNLTGFHKGMLLTAILLLTGGVISGLGIQNKQRASVKVQETQQVPSA